MKIYYHLRGKRQLVKCEEKHVVINGTKRNQVLNLLANEYQINVRLKEKIKIYVISELQKQLLETLLKKLIIDQYYEVLTIKLEGVETISKASADVPGIIFFEQLHPQDINYLNKQLKVYQEYTNLAMAKDNLEVAVLDTKKLIQSNDLSEIKQEIELILPQVNQQIKAYINKLRENETLLVINGISMALDYLGKVNSISIGDELLKLDEKVIELEFIESAKESKKIGKKEAKKARNIEGEKDVQPLEENVLQVNEDPEDKRVRRVFPVTKELYKLLKYVYRQNAWEESSLWNKYDQDLFMLLRTSSKNIDILVMSDINKTDAVIEQLREEGYNLTYVKVLPMYPTNNFPARLDTSQYTKYINSDSNLQKYLAKKLSGNEKLMRYVKRK